MGVVGRSVSRHGCRGEVHDVDFARESSTHGLFDAAQWDSVFNTSDDTTNASLVDAEELRVRRNARRCDYTDLRYHMLTHGAMAYRSHMRAWRLRIHGRQNRGLGFWRFGRLSNSTGITDIPKIERDLIRGSRLKKRLTTERETPWEMTTATCKHEQTYKIFWELCIVTNRRKNSNYNNTGQGCLPSIDINFFAVPTENRHCFFFRILVWKNFSIAPHALKNHA